MKVTKTDDTGFQSGAMILVGDIISFIDPCEELDNTPAVCKLFCMGNFFFFFIWMLLLGSKKSYNKKLLK